MIKNYIIIAWRSLTKNKVFSFINMFGLAIGLACCMLITGYLYQELTYDTYSSNAKQLYRVNLGTVGAVGTDTYPIVDVAVGEGMKNAYPEILASTRLTSNPPLFVEYGSRQFKESQLAGVDSNFLQIFSIPLLEGDNKTALVEPNSVVLTKDMAKKYFGESPALGRIILIAKAPVKVTGVIDKVPDNSHFHADAFISLNTKNRQQTWSNVGFYTYLLLDKNADPKKLEAQFPQLVSKYVVPEIQRDMGVSLAEAQKSVNTFLFSLQPIADIHLHSHTKYEREANGDINYIYIFGVLAVFILILACINFTNLSTAASAKRSKEVGIRKVLGSLKSSLVGQFLAESIMLTTLAMVFALALVYLLLPYFNEVAGKNTTIQFYLNYKALIIELFIALIVGVAAGIYPAFFISSFKILSVLKGNTNSQNSKSVLRSGLIVFQFAISTMFIIGTIIVYQQLHYMQNQKLGYDKEQILVINDTYTLKNNLEPFKNQLLQNKQVVNATISSDVPVRTSDGTQIYLKSTTADASHSEIHSAIYHIDESYLPTMGMKMAAGRNFSPASPGDSSAVIVNETAIKELGIASDPIGKTIVRSGQREFTIVGVVKDFHYSSAKEKIAPLMMLYGHSNGTIMLKVKTADVAGLLSDIKQQWTDFHADSPFSYTFLDDQFAQLYVNEARTGKIFTSFAILAVVIASLGLFGLSAFSIRQRVKEIGIRKVLGASSGSITGMLSAQFLKLVSLSIIIAVPITWYAMHKWLQEFAYRVEIHWWVFIVAGALALMVAFITVSFQSVRAALANPVKSLRSE
ncbi:MULTISPECIES: ABC transporter permease [unclassified Mucilaginibacter]|uniref:ABC transporter permease n=1 Tax=unclassified Mucilaginibacter TaxID=2617802 RepID=UPI002AC8A489|nr:MULTISPECIES: ABC transporter permease [unclassified Mucilaginibacter]MEB0264000.1 ABC transporter permease [Mucilaginibacter sp. 10I4]MEB0279949.1 ABC transporter permease [Mucilaginibacter sp. 10B2]MEB0301809.1 ABC transporter permease [Mucilaginibacter sp. 5C4]WPX21907.1 ABC transporter permease [Mucilaginibacter sp. 5C4]